LRHNVKSRKRWVSWIFQAVVAGVIVVSAAAIGIVLFKIPAAFKGTEIATFVIAALAGFSGVNIIDRLIEMTSPKKAH
jgi:hypothetical protein